MNNSSTIFLNLPPALKEIIGIKKNWYSITSGKSGTRIYKIEDPIHKQFGLYLKIASIKNDRNLIIEAEKLRWLRGKLLVPEVLFSTEVGSIQYLLLTEIPGVPSFNAVFQNNLTYLVKLLAKGLNMVHSIPIISCPFNEHWIYKSS